MPTKATNVEIRTRTVGPWPMNSYALVCAETGESMLIDPGADPGTLGEMLAGTRPVAIVLTHTHVDHLGALEEMRRRLRVPLLAHPGPHVGGMTLEVDRELKDGDTVQLGQQALRVYHAPGHVDDMICLATADHTRVIVGDTLFEGGPGKTWSRADFQTTLHTLREVVLNWPDEATCYPGHGPAFRLGDQRAAIERFLNRDHGAFFGDASWDM